MSKLLLSLVFLIGLAGCNATRGSIQDVISDLADVAPAVVDDFNGGVDKIVDAIEGTTTDGEPDPDPEAPVE